MAGPTTCSRFSRLLRGQRPPRQGLPPTEDCLGSLAQSAWQRPLRGSAHRVGLSELYDSLPDEDRQRQHQGKAELVQQRLRQGRPAASAGVASRRPGPARPGARHPACRARRPGQDAAAVWQGGSLTRVAPSPMYSIPRTTCRSASCHWLLSPAVAGAAPAQPDVAASAPSLPLRVPSAAPLSSSSVAQPAGGPVWGTWARGHWRAGGSVPLPLLPPVSGTAPPLSIACF